MSHSIKPCCRGTHHYRASWYTYYKRLRNKWERQFVHNRLHIGLKEDESLPEKKDACIDRWYYD